MRSPRDFFTPRSLGVPMEYTLRVGLGMAIEGKKPRRFVNTNSARYLAWQGSPTPVQEWRAPS